jgi:hypothetical protein
VSRRAKGAARPTRPPPWLLVVLLVLACGAVLAIAMLARARSERRLAEEAAASAQRSPSPEPEPESESESESEEPPDPLLDKVLAAAKKADAPPTALDAAAHALLVREHFEEAEPLVLRTLAAAPKDAEAVIHRAVLRGVGGDTAGARAELERLARGEAGWEASLFAAGFALRDGDNVAALRALRRFRAAAPPTEITPELTAEIAELERRLGRPVTSK